MYIGYFIKVLLLLFYMTGVCTGIVKHGYMTNYFYSHRPVEVNDSLILELTSRVLEDRPAKEHLACDVNIVTHPSRRILIHFLSLEISYDQKEVDRLHVIDYKLDGKDVELTPSQGLYGIFNSFYHGATGRLDDYQSTGHRLKLDYQGKPTLAYDGFKILITSFRESRGDCGRGYLRCVRKGICIPVSLWCDGYQNCGNDDNSDEANCDLNLEPEWKPIDGTVAAVLAAAVSSVMFVISLSILAFVVVKISKRQTLTTNITVEYKRRKSPKRQLSNGQTMTRLFAPPSYEVVIGMDEEPPPYQWVAGEGDTESDEEDGVLREQPIQQDSGNSSVITPEVEDEPVMEVIQTNRNSPDSKIQGATSTVVSCDVHGNDVVISPDIDIDYEADNSENQSNFLAQTNYRLCSATPPSGSLKKMAPERVRDIQSEPDIEVISSDDSDSSKDSNRNSKSKCNGNIKYSKTNGDANTSKINGHSRVSYERSPSAREYNAINFVNID